MKNYSLYATILTTSQNNLVDTNVSTEMVGNLSKTIAEFGIMVVCCSILLIFSIVMFRVVIKRFNDSDREMQKTLSQSLDTITKVMETNVNVAEIFDRHNTKSTLEFERLHGEIKSLQDTIDDLKDQNEKLKRMIDKDIYLVDQINQTISQISYETKPSRNRNTMSR